MGGEEVIRDDEKDVAENKLLLLQHRNKMGDEEEEGAKDGDQRINKLMCAKEKSFKLRNESLNWLRLRRVFDLFDKNGDGVITMDEIRQALVLLGLSLEDVDHDNHSQEDDRELQATVSSFIKPGNQGLDFEDFRALHNSFFDDNNNPAAQDEDEDEDEDEDQQQQQVESDLMEAFKVFDSDGDGYISAAELQQVLSKLGFPEAQQELHHIQLMISSFDHNHDGQVDFFEFKLMMSRTLLN